MEKGGSVSPKFQEYASQSPEELDKVDQWPPCAQVTQSQIQPHHCGPVHSSTLSEESMTKHTISSRFFKPWQLWFVTPVPLIPGGILLIRLIDRKRVVDGSPI